MNTFQLTCFIAVAEVLNFARAAEHLHVTQPAVTQQIHSLEKELNTVLFKRTTRTVKLTPEGMAFLNDARHIVALSERAKRRFEEPHGREIQLLSLGCYNDAQLFWLAPVLRRLREAFPNLHPRLQVAPAPYLLRLLEDGDVDAVLGFRMPGGKKTKVQYKKVGRTPLVCLCPPGHPLTGSVSVSIEDLQGEKLVLFDPTKPQAEAMRQFGQQIGERTPADLYFCESTEAIITLVQAGFGVAILPGMLAPSDNSCAAIPIKDAEEVSFGVYYKSVQGRAMVKALIQALQEEEGKVR